MGSNESTFKYSRLSCRIDICLNRSSIIAIHGLSGHPESTWTGNDGGVFRLRDMLSTEITLYIPVTVANAN